MIEIVIFSWVFAFAICLYAYIKHRLNQKKMNENLKEQLKSLEKHLKWCVDNNKPQEHLDVHIGVISDIKQEIKQLKPKKDE